MRKRTKIPVVTRVVAYIRVSTEQQASDGNSLEAQRAKLEAYATAMELEIVAFEIDAGRSASSLERPGLQRALDMTESGEVDGMLVTKLDRLTRSVRDLLVLIDEYFHEASLLSVSESIDTRTAGGRMVLKILTTVGEWEREAVGERTKAIMQHMKAEGMFTGGFPPFGFTLEEGHLTENEEEQATLARVVQLRKNGVSIRKIAGVLINPRTGRHFHPTQIARMV